MSKMKGVVLPGNSTVEFREFDIPKPGPRQVLLKMKASTICGSDIRAIYREHLGKGPEGYQGVICGHEPAGQIVEVGSDCKTFKSGDRVVLYHISSSGGISHNMRLGYQIACSSPQRAAYGWQRDGGMADYCVAEEMDCVLLPDSLSFVDAACVACGYGTCYEALRRINVSGNDVTLIVGLGPMGLAALALARSLGSTPVIGVDINDDRVALTKKLGLADHVFKSDENTLQAIKDVTGGRGCEATVDCSGNTHGRQLAIKATREWGRCAFVGEGGTVEFEPSPTIIHNQITIYGSWVTSLGNMEDLVERLDRWNLHPEETVTHRYSLDQCAEAYQTMDAGSCGKVAVVWDD